MNRSLLCGVFIAAAAALCLFPSTALSQVQVGARFPQGIVIGPDAEECNSTLEGKVRFVNGALEVCYANGTWAGVGADSLSLTEIRSLLENVLFLLSERDDPSASPQDRANYENCFNNGVFTAGMNSFDEDHCVCYDDNTRGHYVGARCSFCAEGWVHDEVGRCLGDNNHPEVTLMGESVQLTPVGSPHVEPGYSAYDAWDGDLTGAVVVSGTVDTDTIGEYVLMYYVEDAAGFSAAVNRTVKVTVQNVAGAGVPAYTVLPGIDTYYDTCSSGTCNGRTVSFYKELTSSTLRVVWTDNFRCLTYDSGKSCRWELRVNGQSCDKPMYFTTLSYARTSDSTSAEGILNYHRGATMTAHCESIQGAPLQGQAWYTISVHFTGSGTALAAGAPLLGWPSWTNDGVATTIEASEIYGNVEADTRTSEISVGVATGTAHASVYDVAFTQPVEGGVMRFVYFDNFQCTPSGPSTSASCRLELTIDGFSCASPGPMYIDVHTSPYRDVAIPSSSTHYCSATTEGPITVGSHTLGIRMSTVPSHTSGNMRLGYGGTTALVEIAPIQNATLFSWVSLPPQFDETANAVLPSRTATFTKQEYGSVLRIKWFDNLRCLASSGSSCRWIILIDGQECVEPYMLGVDRYSDGAGGDNYHSGVTTIGWCTRLTSLHRILPGEHTITIVEKASPEHTHGNPFVGWYETRPVFEVEEFPLFQFESTDTEAPYLELQGEPTSVVFTGEPYVESGWIAYDDHDGDLAASVTVSSDLNVNVSGTYTIYYTATDSAGNSVQKTRTVIVSGDNQLRSLNPNIFAIPGSSAYYSDPSTRNYNFYKARTSSMMRITWSDNFRCYTDGPVKSCRWELRINGASCSSPGPIYMDYHVEGRTSHQSSSLGTVNYHWMATVTGYCSAINGAQLAGGNTYTLSAHYVGSADGGTVGAQVVGWPGWTNAGVGNLVEATEVVEWDHLAIHNVPTGEVIAPSSYTASVISGRLFEFTQPVTGQMLRFVYYDALNCRQRNGTLTEGSCRVELRINNATCTSPGPMVIDKYHNPYRNVGISTTHTTMCSETTAGPIPAGTHEVSLWYSRVPFHPPAELSLSWHTMQPLLEVTPLRPELASYNYNVFAVTGDTTSNGLLPSRTFQFHKEEYGTWLRIKWSDNVRCQQPDSGGYSCRWHIKIDGQACAEPHLLGMDHYNQGPSTGDNSHHPTSVVQYCRSLGGGLYITPGNHQITITESASPSHSHGAPYVGWYQTLASFEVEEIAYFPFEADTTAPYMVLNGSSPMSVSTGSPYVEPGVQAWDDHDGNLASQVSVSGTVNVNAPGTYTLTYSVSDSAGNNASISRQVNVA